MPRSKNPKMTLARKMLSTIERRNGTPPFLSENWTLRLRARQNKIINKKK